MSRRQRNRDEEATVESPPAAPATPLEAKRTVRPGRVMVRALRASLIEAMPRYAGDVFSMAEADLEKHFDRGDVEPV